MAKEAKSEKAKYVIPDKNPLWNLMDSMRVRVVMSQPLLATLPDNPDLYKEFIVNRRPNNPNMVEEIALHKAAMDKQIAEREAAIAEKIAKAKADGVEIEKELEDKPVTVFARNAKQELVIRDYYVRGFMKASLRAFIELGIAPTGLNAWNFKGAVDQFLQVGPVHIPLLQANGEVISEAAGYNVRSQRVTTMQGDRVCLACSEELPAGTMAEFDIKWFKSSSGKAKQAIWEKALVGYLLDFGQVVGLGQWRSGGYGRFTWSEVPTTPVTPAA